MPVKNAQDDLPSISAEDEAELHKILVDQGQIDGEAAPPAAEAAEAEPADDAEADADDGVFDDDEEAQEAKAIARDKAKQEAEAQAKAAEGEGEEEAEEGEEGDKEDEAKDDKAPSLARGLASVARKEAKAREREQVAAQREREAQAAVQALENFKRLAVEDPAAFYEAIGLKDRAMVAADLYYAEHPEAAPQGWRDRKKGGTLEREIAALRSKLEEQERSAQAQAARGRAITYLSAVARNIPAELPHLRAVASDDPEKFAVEMYDRMMQMRAAGELAGAQDDEEVAAIVAQDMNSREERNYKRYKRLESLLAAANQNGKNKTGTKQPVKITKPVAGETKTAPRTINGKKVKALTRPRKEPASHEEDIARVLEDIKAGRARV